MRHIMGIIWMKRMERYSTTNCLRKRKRLTIFSSREMGRFQRVGSPFLGIREMERAGGYRRWTKCKRSWLKGDERGYWTSWDKRRVAYLRGVFHGSKIFSTSSREIVGKYTMSAEYIPGFE